MSATDNRLSKRMMLSSIGAIMNVTGLQRKALAKPALHFLYLHHVHDMSWFRSFVAQVQSEFELVAHDEALKRVRSGDYLRPGVSFSFDDGFKSNQEAAGILKEFGTSATLFVCTDLVGRDQNGVTEFFGNSQPEGVLSWEDLECLQDQGHSIGCHTRSHANLAQQSEEQLVDEIIGSRQSLISQLGSCDHFAWPYGRKQFISLKALKVASDAGFKSIASAIRGSHVTRNDGILLRHVVQSGQPFAQLKRFMAMAFLGWDNHRKQRAWADSMTSGSINQNSESIRVA